MRKLTKKSAIDDIRQLRNEESFFVDSRNMNPYAVLVKEKNGHTAYCFSAPIYQKNNGKLVVLQFEKKDKKNVFIGSDCKITVSENKCLFERKDEAIKIQWEDPVELGDKNRNSSLKILPTYNGIRVIGRKKKIHFSLQWNKGSGKIRFNSLCFALMKEKFQPYFSVASLYSMDSLGNIHPLAMKYSELSPGKFAIEFNRICEEGVSCFEINFYEPKLFQDTTVQSNYPKRNNAYGAMAFVGKTEELGEEWLYSRVDISKLMEFSNKSIQKITLHIPKISFGGNGIELFIPRKRFCSFGSNWEKRIGATNKRLKCDSTKEYLSVDLTDVFIDPLEKRLIYNEGFIMKKSKEKENYVPISTGDSYSYPQILEINYQ